MADERTEDSQSPRPGTDFERVYREHFTFVWRCLKRLGIAERELQDGCQDVFLVVHDKIGQFDGGGKITTWLYAICYRVASDRRRRAYQRREVIHAAPEEVELPEPPPPIEFDRRRALLQAALDALPIEQRAVFTLFELEGLRGDEIAAMLGIPVPTVHSRLRLAREGFRRALVRAAARDQVRLRRTGVIP